MELGSKFEFIVDKIENNTLYVSQIVQNSSDLTRNASFTNTSSTSTYDSEGAARYIVVVVLIYGFSIIFFIGSQVRSTKKITDDVDSVDAEKVLRSMENEIFAREVLQKLSDKQLREKAWRIYVQDRLSSNQLKDSSIDELKEIERIENKIRLNTLNNQSSFKKDLSRKLSFFLKGDSPTKSDDAELADRSVKFKNSKSTPLLVLQTDEDGLYKLRKSKRKTNQEDSEISSASSSHKKLRSSLKSHNTINDANSVKFDLLEITEQISSV